MLAQDQPADRLSNALQAHRFPYGHEPYGRYANVVIYGARKQTKARIAAGQTKHRRWQGDLESAVGSVLVPTCCLHKGA